MKAEEGLVVGRGEACGGGAGRDDGAADYGGHGMETLEDL